MSDTGTAVPPRRYATATTLTIVLLLAAAALALHRIFTALGWLNPPSVAIIALLAGLLLRNSVRPPKALLRQGSVLIPRLIGPAIVCMGAGLNLGVLADPHVGVAGLVVTIACMVIAFGGAYIVSRWLRLSTGSAVLLGAGTAVCGNAAIVAVAPLIDARDEEIGLSLGVVNLFGLLVMLALPPIALYTNTSAEAAGIWAGASVHAVPQAVAAGYAVSDSAGELATLFKLARVAMLAPMVLLIALLAARSSQKDVPTSLTRRAAKLVPWFIWGFLLLSILNTLQVLSIEMDLPGLGDEAVSLSALFTSTGKVLLTLAMAAIGLGIHLKGLLGVGMRALLAGLISSALLMAASYGLIMLLG